MNRNKSNSRMGFQIISLVLTFVISTAFSSYGFAQEDDEPVQYKTRMKMEFTKKGDGVRVIKAVFSAMIDRKPTPIENIPLSFYDVSDSIIMIGEAMTDEKGVAYLTLPNTYKIGKDTAKSKFSVEYEGSEEYKASAQELSVKDAQIEATYEIIDSVYTVSVSAFELMNGEKGEPLTDMDVYVYVQRMFSLLKVGEGWLQDGEATIEIPQDLPGDEDNNLKLITKIPETEDFGTIENEALVNWGVVDSLHHAIKREKRRALWKPMAPLWMVVTLSILMFGVFYHYLLIMYKLYKINKLNKKAMTE